MLYLHWNEIINHTLKGNNNNNKKKIQSEFFSVYTQCHMQDDRESKKMYLILTHFYNYK